MYKLRDIIANEVEQAINTELKKKITSELRVKLEPVIGSSDNARGRRVVLKHCIDKLESETDFSVTSLHTYVKCEIINLTRLLHRETLNMTEFLIGKLSTLYEIKTLIEGYLEVEPLAEQHFKTCITRLVNERYGVGHMNISDNYRIVLKLDAGTYQIVFDNDNESYSFYELCDDYIFMTKKEVDVFLNGSQTFYDDIAKTVFNLNKSELILERFLETESEYLLIEQETLFIEQGEC